MKNFDKGQKVVLMSDARSNFEEGDVVEILGVNETQSTEDMKYYDIRGDNPFGRGKFREIQAGSLLEDLDQVSEDEDMDVAS